MKARSATNSWSARSWVLRLPLVVLLLFLLVLYLNLPYRALNSDADVFGDWGRMISVQ